MLAPRWLGLIGLGLLCFVPALVYGQETSESVTGKVTRVTMYRGQALVTREIPIGGAKGAQEWVVTGLPLTIQEGSLYAESSEEVEIRAVRFRQRPVSEEPREEVRALDDELSEIEKSLAVNQKNQELAQQKLAYLDSLQNFVAPTAQHELTRGVLDAETLGELTEFSFQQREKLASQQVELAAEQQELQQALELVKRRRAELTRESQKTVNEAILFLEKVGDADGVVELNYLVSRCGWSPVYSIRSSQDQANVSVEYNALIQQQSGEDWSDVELMLSTASPALSATGPSLAPFRISLQDSQPNPPGLASQVPSAGQQQMMSRAPVDELTRTYNANRAQQRAANEKLGKSVTFDDKADLNWSINQFAGNGQTIELTNSLSTLSSLQLDNDDANAPSMSYQLKSAVSLASRNEQQMVRIHRGDLPSEFYFVASPLISSYVYREAEVDNTSEIDFLAGPVSVYLDGRFVGRAEIPTVAQGETFVLGFGSDAQLRARRELVDKSEAIQGGNKEIRMEYRLLIENYKTNAVAVRLFDRLPYTRQTDEIRITLDDTSRELSDDPVYLRRERPKNILRWDIEVPADVARDKAAEVRYTYSLDFDRSHSIGDASNEQGIQEFLELERARLKR